MRRDPDRAHTPEVLADLEALDAALRGEPAADELRAVVTGARVDAPRMDAATRARLDQRVAAAAERSRPARRAARTGRTRTAAPPWRRRLLPALAVAAALVVVVPVGVSTLRDDDAVTGGAVDAEAPSLSRERSDDQDGAAAPSATPPSALSQTTTEASPAVPAAPADRPVPPGTPRAVARDVEQVLRVRERALAGAAREVPAIVSRAGGFVASSSVRERGAAAGADFELEVPEPRLEATIARLGRLGAAVRLDRDAEDLTTQVVSVEDRLRDLRAERSTVRRQLARAEDGSRADRLRTRLSSLTSRVSGLEAQQRTLRDRTGNARISLDLLVGSASTAGSEDEDDGAWGVTDAFSDAGRVLDVGGGALVVALTVLLPPALLAWLLVLGLRHTRRRGRERELDATA